MTKRNRVTAAIAFAVAALIVDFAFVRAHAQGAAAFTQRARLEALMDNSPALVVSALESLLTQEQINALESALFIAIPNDRKRETLESVKAQLLSAGLAETDPIVVAVEQRAEALSTGSIDVSDEKE